MKVLSVLQIRFVIARNETKSDKEAAEAIQISPETVKAWNKDGSKDLVDEAVKLFTYDGMITALELRRRHLAKAMAVKVAGLDSADERLRQAVSTEIIEWELGKAVERKEVSGKDGEALSINVKVIHADD